MRTERSGIAYKRARRQILLLLVVGSTIAFYPHTLCGQPIASSLSYSRAPDHILLAVSHEIGRIRNPDTTPLVRVYGDGHVHVHYPIYMKKSGDYETRLSSAELTTLLQALIGHGVMTFDSQGIAENRATIRATRRQQAKTNNTAHEETDIGDDEAIRLDVDLDSVVMPKGLRIHGADAKRTLRWINLQSDLQDFPELTSLAEFAACVQAVKVLTTHSNLVPVLKEPRDEPLQ